MSPLSPLVGASTDKRRDLIATFVRNHRSEWVDASELVAWIREQFGRAPFPGRGDVQALLEQGRLEYRKTRRTNQRFYTHSFRARTSP